jgi:hypothetical protein
MVTTTLVCVVFGGLGLIELLWSAWLLQLGARWVGAAGLTFSRSVITLLLMGAAGLVVVVLVEFAAGIALRGQAETYGYAAAIVALVLGLVAMWAVAQKGLRTTLARLSAPSSCTRDVGT